MIYSHSGDLGDIIYGLSLAKHTGCDKFIVFDYNGGPQRSRINKTIYASIEPLLLSQKYINKPLYCHREYITPMVGFRHWLKWFSIPESHFFAYQHSREKALEFVCGNTWLDNIPIQKIKKVIVNKSPRYWHHGLNISDFLKNFDDSDIGFIGSESEYNEFSQQYNVKYSYIRTPTLLHAASVIAGSELFVGNGSCCAAIAQSMRHPSVIFIHPGNKKSINFNLESTHFIENGIGNVFDLYLFLSKHNINLDFGKFHFLSNSILLK